MSAAMLEVPSLGPIWPLDMLPASVARDRFPSVWATYEARLPQLSTSDLAKVVSIAVGVCPHCFEEPRGCSCINY